MSEAINGRSRSAPFFRPDQIDAMHKAFEQVRTRLRLTGPKALPVIELVAIRIVELAREGEFDPDKLTKAMVAEFNGVAETAAAPTSRYGAPWRRSP